MTVEIDQATLIRNNTAPASMTAGDSILSIGTPSIVPASQGAVGSPTASIMSTPTVNDNIINKKADPAQGLYQTCLTLRERLRDVPDFEKFLEPPEDADPSIPEDPVTQLWRCFRMGSSLCVLFNATRPVELIRDDRLSPSLKTVNDCKAATFHFLKGIKQELDIQGDDAFMIHNLYSDDTNGFVKVRDYRPVTPSLLVAQTQADENTGGPEPGVAAPTFCDRDSHQIFANNDANIAPRVFR
jgi:cell division control protein 24